MAGRGRGRRGFTLIESVVAMALLAFVIADVGMVAIYASRGGTSARRLTGAVSLAENAIEHARSADFNRIRLADGPGAVCFTGSGAEIFCGDPGARVVRECFSVDLAPVACGGAGAFYARDRDVTTPPGTTLADALSARIDVEVSWNEPPGGSREYRLASIISKY